MVPSQIVTTDIADFYSYRRNPLRNLRSREHAKACIDESNESVSKKLKAFNRLSIEEFMTESSGRSWIQLKF
jgi:hypothetical protein